MTDVQKEIYSVSCNDITYSVKSPIYVARDLRLELLKDEAVYKVNYSDDTSEDITKEEAFHITALILNQNKKRDIIYNETVRLAEHKMNKYTNQVNTINKRRNKRKLNKKYKK